ncbi:hypothetical protein C0585_01370 [Candidatus Woesearchaeota archaeon]|nr:MAG: hypothetical protein C0585_01370 [Candidatus Woesearchaeota archaeon]
MELNYLNNLKHLNLKNGITSKQIIDILKGKDIQFFIEDKSEPRGNYFLDTAILVPGTQDMVREIVGKENTRRHPFVPRFGNLFVKPGADLEDKTLKYDDKYYWVDSLIYYGLHEPTEDFNKDLMKRTFFMGEKGLYKERTRIFAYK